MAQNIHILFEHAADLRPFGCSYIRLILPLLHPSNGDKFEVTYGTDYKPSDIILIERTWKPNLSIELAEQLVAHLREDNVCLIYEIDDNLLDLANVSVKEKMIVRYFAREADGILVTNNRLKNRLARLNKNVITVPNALDEQLFRNSLQKSPPRQSKNGKIIVGYMGTFTHEADLMLAFQALRTLLRRYAGRLEFQLVGGASNPSVIQAFNDLPFRVLNVETKNVEYPKFVRWMIENVHWDLAIAPLEDTYFNQFKSDIKFLDYSALGIPGIYSQVPAYQQSVRHLDTGYLVEDDPDAWIEAMERLIQEDGLRASLAENAQNYVLNTRTLKHSALRWHEAIHSIYQSSAYT